MVAIAAWTLPSCSSPDTEAEFDDFVEARSSYIPDGSVLPDASGGTLTSGRYFMSVNTTVMPGALLFLETTVTVSSDGTSADFVLQPVKTDLDASGNPRADARVPVGDPVTITGVAVTDGNFTIEAGEVTVSGDANPITTGAQIVANLTLIGVVSSDTVFCGTVNGDVTEPIEINIDNSTFGAEAYEGDFTEISAPIDRCPAGDTGDEVPDAGGD